MGLFFPSQGRIFRAWLSLTWNRMWLGVSSRQFPTFEITFLCFDTYPLRYLHSSVGVWFSTFGSRNAESLVNNYFKCTTSPNDKYKFIIFTRRGHVETKCHRKMVVLLQRATSHILGWHINSSLSQTNYSIKWNTYKIYETYICGIPKVRWQLTRFNNNLTNFIPPAKQRPPTYCKITSENKYYKLHTSIKQVVCCDQVKSVISNLQTVLALGSQLIEKC